MQNRVSDEAQHIQIDKIHFKTFKIHLLKMLARFRRTSKTSSSTCRPTPDAWIYLCPQ